LLTFSHTCQAGASPKIRNNDGKSATDLAEEKNRRDLAQMLRRSALGAHETVYKVAVLNMTKAALSAGDVEVLRAIVKEEPAVVQSEFLPDMEGDTALHYSAALSFSETTELLLQELSCDPNTAGSHARHPLHFAASSGNLPTVLLLLDSKANINAATDDGSTALAVSCSKGHAGVADALVAKGCDASILDSSGLAAIHHAARKCHKDCVSVLAASVNTLDSRRDPPLYASFVLLQFENLFSTLMIPFPLRYHALISSCSCEEISDTVSLLLNLGASPVVPCPSAANSLPGAVAHAFGCARVCCVCNVIAFLILQLQLQTHCLYAD
jgi:hypothetical protein